jgi:TonB family protein
VRCPEIFRVTIGLILLGLILLAPVSMAADVKIVANPSVRADAVSVSELKSVYLLERRTLKDGSPVEPVLQKTGPTHDAFLRLYLDRDAQEVRAYYLGLAFTGKGSLPKELHSDAEVLDYVAKTRGAIGYVSLSAGTEGVKVLAVTDEEKKSERRLLVRVEPEYPETLRAMQIGGVVRVRLVISPKGSVENASLLGGNPILGDAAMAAVRKWVYAPAASQTSTEVTLRFDPHR